METGSPSKDRLHVLVSSTSYPKDGSDWRGVFIRRQLDGLSSRGDLRVGAWMPPGPRPESAYDATSSQDAAWLAELMDRGGIAHALRTRPMAGLLRAISLLRRMRGAFARSDADIFHVNWLQNALALPDDGRPALVTALGTDMQLLRIPGVRHLVRRSLGGRKVAICPNADWMVQPLQAAFGDVADVSCIPFGIDEGWYSIDRDLQSASRPKWLCVTRLTSGKLGPLFEWTAPYFADGHAELHLIGPMQEQIALPSWVHWHGPASPDALRTTWFPNAHGLITLSHHPEGRPQVMLEALASGLPIIASRVPAHEDLLRDGDVGVLVDTPGEAMTALSALADAEDNRRLGRRGKARMLTDIGTWDDCAGRYATVYRSLTGTATP